MASIGFHSCQTPAGCWISYPSQWASGLRTFLSKLHYYDFFQLPNSAFELHLNYSGRQGQTCSSLRKHHQSDNTYAAFRKHRTTANTEMNCKYRKRQRKCFQPTLKVLDTPWTRLLPRFVTREVIEVVCVSSLLVYVVDFWLLLQLYSVHALTVAAAHVNQFYL